MMKSVVGVLALLLLATSPLDAQWLTHPTPGTPRTKDGKPDLSAPAPKGPDGKPDFSGVWGFDAGPALIYALGDLKPEEMQQWARDVPITLRPRKGGTIRG